MLSQIATDIIPGYKPPIDVLVKGVSDDSRTTRPGDLFCAVTGESSDGRQYVGEAVAKGAVAIACDPPAVTATVPVLEISNLADCLGRLAASVYEDPGHGLTIIAVTGTNGKTSFTHLLAQALTGLGMRAGLIGTMGHGLPGALTEPGLTTPTAVDLQRRLKHLKDRGCQAVVLEASSHGLVQGRLNSVAVSTAVLTNLTHDHLDYHDSIESYKAAKQILFELETVKQVVVNLDDPFAYEIVKALGPDVKSFEYSMHEPFTDIRCANVTCTEEGIKLVIDVLVGESISATLPLYGKFNVENVLAVVATLFAMGFSAQTIESALSALTPVAGRMDVIRRKGLPGVIVDYAHTPDALEKCLQAVRDHFPDKRICCVFGCGGDRDKSKRPMMGGIASRLADEIVVTSDNPRQEDPLTIIDEICEGIVDTEFVVIADRGSAIHAAITNATSEDIVLVAGKGHEDYQETADGRIAFSDYREINRALEQKNVNRQWPVNVVAGLGETGLSYARYLTSQGETFSVVDHAAASDRIAVLHNISPDAEVYGFDSNVLTTAKRIYVSPGVPLDTPALLQARERGASVIGDVGLFGKLASAPIVAITGTNGKSTVTELVAQLAADQQPGVRVAGNIGLPCLDALSDDASLYVLEVSSYQLELADQLPAEIAVVLNLSPDHLDRYPDEQSYYDTKLGVYRNCRSAVINRALSDVIPRSDFERVASFGEDKPDGDFKQEGHFGVVTTPRGLCLVNGEQILIEASELSLKGHHNIQNILAALAIGWLLKLDVDRMVEVARTFYGLPHRSEFIREIGGVRYVNDSKATNPGAMIAAVKGEATGRNVHLIAGGVSKNTDLSGLSVEIGPYLASVHLIGESQYELAEVLSEFEPVLYVSLDDAVVAASVRAVPGDLVLLAPGCASFDQFKNFVDRGDAFRKSVIALASGVAS